MVQKPTQDVIIHIIQEAVSIEIDFLTKALPVRLLGMSCEKMATYIKFVADRLLLDLGCPTVCKFINHYLLIVYELILNYRYSNHQIHSHSWILYLNKERQTFSKKELVITKKLR